MEKKNIKLFSSLKFPKGKLLFLWLYTIVLIIISMLLFNQLFDMSLTTWHTHDFLDCLFSGKISQFYSITAEKAANNQYFSNGINMDAASYSPFTYAVLSVVIFPIYIIIKILGITQIYSAYAEAIRLFMVGFSIWASMLLKKICDEANIGKAISTSTYYYFSSPIFIVCTLICNQYDVIAIIICLYAILAFMKGRHNLFSLLMGISACFKPFAIVAFFPIILFKEKNLFGLLKKSLLALCPLLITNFLPLLIDSGYRNIVGVREENFSFFSSLTDATIKGGLSDISLFFLAYVILCGISYCMNNKVDDSFYKAMLLGLASYMVFFTFVKFNIHWMIYIFPFLSIVVLFSKNYERMLVMESGFSWFYVISAFMSAPITNQVYYSPFFTTHPEIPLELTDDLYFYEHYLPSKIVPFTLMVGFGVALLLSAYKATQEDCSQELKSKNTEFVLLLIRASSILLYIVPALISIFMVCL